MSRNKLEKKSKDKRNEKRARQRRLAVAAERSASTPARPQPSPSPASPEDERGLALLRKFDPQAGVRNALREIAARDDLWAGIPMPLDGEQLVIEPKYPHAQAMMAMGAVTEAEVQADERKVPGKIRSAFFSDHKRSHIVIFELEDGRIDWGVSRGAHPLMMALRTLGCSDAWGIEQESKALQLLGSMVTHRQFKQYLLTGSFLERSPRSHVTYLFRKLRPTVAMHTGKSGKVEIMCALCQHGVGYYQGSWAGVLCPTDDVVGALAMMRGDEAHFWRTSNQHPAISPFAGVY